MIIDYEKYIGGYPTGMTISLSLKWITTKDFAIACEQYLQRNDRNRLNATINDILSDIDAKISLCRNKLRNDEAINALKYLIALCEDFKKRFCAGLNYNIDYEPTEDEILEEIGDNLSIYLDSEVKAGNIIYLEEYDAYTDEIQLDLSKRGGRPYIESQHEANLIERYYDLFSESASESVIEYYKTQHEYAVTIEREICNRQNKAAHEIGAIQQDNVFLDGALKFGGIPNKKIILSDYLRSNNGDKMLNAIHSYLSGKKGKSLAIAIRALEQDNYIDIPDRGLREFHSTLRVALGSAGSYEGFAKYYKERASSITPDEINKAIIEFESHT